MTVSNVGVARKALFKPVVVALLFFGAWAAVPAMASAAPQTTITSGPTGFTTEAIQQITFTSDDANAYFQCKLGETAYESCASPYTVNTSGGYNEHTFYVRAVSVTEVDPTPAVATWHYLPPFAPPIVQYTTPVPGTTRMKLKNFKLIAGSAYSTSPVAEVRVMMRLYVKGDEKARDELNNRVCTHIDMKSGKRIRRDCFDRPYARAKGREDWLYRLPKKVRKSLRPGKYTIEVRAFNSMNSIEKKLFVIRLLR